MECRLFSSVAEFYTAYPDNEFAKRLVEGHAEHVKMHNEEVEKLCSEGHYVSDDITPNGYSTDCPKGTKMHKFDDKKYMEFTSAKIPDVRVFMMGFKALGEYFVFE